MAKKWGRVTDRERSAIRAQKRKEAYSRFNTLKNARDKIESACLDAMPLVFREAEREVVAEEGFFEIVRRTAAEIEIACTTAYHRAKP